jgi:hypothetical protein
MQISHAWLPWLIKCCTLQRQGPTDDSSSGQLAALLHLYTIALKQHAACAALQPQISPLPGQALQLDAAAADPSGTGPLLHAFDALRGPDDKDDLPRMPDLARTLLEGEMNPLAYPPPVRKASMHPDMPEYCESFQSFFRASDVIGEAPDQGASALACR